MENLRGESRHHRVNCIRHMSGEKSIVWGNYRKIYDPGSNLGLECVLSLEVGGHTGEYIACYILWWRGYGEKWLLERKIL